MIKALGKVGGRPMLLLGLSGENVTRLMAGEPIMFDGVPYGFDGRVVIVGGRTERDITDELKRHGLPTPGCDADQAASARAAVVAALRASVRTAATACVSTPDFADGAWCVAVETFVAELGRCGYEVVAGVGRV